MPPRWDLADLEEEVRYYLAHPSECARITTNAFQALQQHFSGERCIEPMRAVVQPAQRAPASRPLVALSQLRN